MPTTADLHKVRVYDSNNAIVDTFGIAKGTRTFTTFAPTTGCQRALASNTNRKEALIRNNGSQVVYLGKDSTLLTTNGFPLAPGETLRDDRTTGDWYAVVASGTGDLRIIEVS